MSTKNQVPEDAKSTREVPTRFNESKLQVLYVNHVAMQVSNLDTKLRLGLVRNASEEAVDVDVVADIYFAHATFRALATMLARNLDVIGSAKGEEPPA